MSQGGGEEGGRNEPRRHCREHESHRQSHMDACACGRARECTLLLPAQLSATLLFSFRCRRRSQKSIAARLLRTNLRLQYKQTERTKPATWRRKFAAEIHSTTPINGKKGEEEEAKKRDRTESSSWAKNAEDQTYIRSSMVVDDSLRPGLRRDTECGV